MGDHLTYDLVQQRIERAARRADQVAALRAATRGAPRRPRRLAALLAASPRPFGVRRPLEPVACC